MESSDRAVFAVGRVDRCQRGKVKSDPISNNDEVFVHFTETGILLISSNLNQFKGSFAAFIRLEIRASC